MEIPKCSHAHNSISIIKARQMSLILIQASTLELSETKMAFPFEILCGKAFDFIHFFNLSVTIEGIF